jgi:hypothetical protein
MRTQEEIQRQIEGLKKERATLPPYSAFGTPNHQIMDAQIAILNGTSKLEDFPEGDLDADDAESQIFRGAEDAKYWLDDETAEDLFGEV